jgi:hypothetical protein
MSSKAVKYNALKDNVMITVKGFSWNWCKHLLSKDGWKYMVKELANHLQWISIWEEKKHTIPDEPMPNVSKRINLPVLGMQTKDVL